MRGRWAPLSSLKFQTFLDPGKYLSLTLLTWNITMIISFGNPDTEKVWNGIRIKKLPGEIQNIGRRKLRMLNNSVNLTDLRVPPANRLEKLSGKLKDFYSIRINDQRRIIFKWDSGSASEVEIIDYH
jgi:proteic killer suppression protein